MSIEPENDQRMLIEVMMIQIPRLQLVSELQNHIEIKDFGVKQEPITIEQNMFGYMVYVQHWLFFNSVFGLNLLREKGNLTLLLF